MGIAFYVRCQEGRHLRNHFSFSWEITSESKIFLLSELSFAASPSETLLNWHFEVIRDLHIPSHKTEYATSIKLNFALSILKH